MSATSRADFEISSAANVRFSVRCEKLGHGEELFLVPDSDQCVKKVRSLCFPVCFCYLAEGVRCPSQVLYAQISIHQSSSVRENFLEACESRYGRFSQADEWIDIDGLKIVLLWATYFLWYVRFPHLIFSPLHHFCCCYLYGNLFFMTLLYYRLHLNQTKTT